MKLPTGFVLGLIGLISANSFGVELPKYPVKTKRLYLDHEYIQKNRAPDYWAISPYYVPQRNIVSCSAASAVMVLNAMRAPQKQTSTEELFTQDAFVKKMDLDFYTKRTTAPVSLVNINYADYGVILTQFETVFKQAFKKLGFEKASVERIPADGSKKSRDQILKLLIANEKNDTDFIIANFLQKSFTEDPEGDLGHIAPVGAFDEKKKMVLLFDPDRDYYEPYWVTLDTFFKGIEEKDGEGTPRGILYIKTGR